MPPRPAPACIPLLAVVLAALALPAAARAADGVIELNQASALAGNPSIGDNTPGFPIRIAQSGSYRLTSNLRLVGGASEVIDVDADHVTIDLNGFVLGACAGVSGLCILPPAGNGIDALGDADVTVRNGTVERLPGFGIRCGDRGRVEDVVVRNVSSTAILVGSGGAVRGSSVIDSGDVGATAAISGAAGLLISGNVLTGNGDIGIFVEDGSLVEGNTVTGNDGAGIVATGATLVRGNMVRGNGGVGLDCSGAASNQIGYVENSFQDNDGNAEPQVTSSCVNLGGNLCRSSMNATCP